MPTRIYSIVEFTTLFPFLQALTAFGKANERDEHDNGYEYDN